MNERNNERKIGWKCDISETQQTPWCSPCQETHREDECPQRDEDYFDSMNFMDMICNFQNEEITREQIGEARI